MKPSYIKPRFAALIALAMAVIMVVTAYLEIERNRSDMFTALQQEALSLIETIDRSAETTMISSFEVEQQLAGRLLDNGRYIALLERAGGLSQRLLLQIAERNAIRVINLYDRDGRWEVGTLRSPAVRRFLDAAFLEELRPLMREPEGELVVGLRSDIVGDEMHYIVAVARPRQRGVVLVAYDSAYLLEFRRRIGLGRLVQEIGDNEEIAYVLLQDYDGILTASRGVSAIDRIEDDPFLQRAIAVDSVLTRVTQFEGLEIFEVVKPFYVEGEFYGLFRLGLSLERIEAFNRRTVHRFILLSIAVVIVGVIVFSFLSATQSHALLKDEYRRMQTSTGAVLENMAEAVVASDGKGIITVFNKAAEDLFERRAHDVLGTSCADVIDVSTSCIERTLTSGQAIEYEETEFVTRTGRRLIVGLSTSVIRSTGGEIETVIAVMKDLTEQRRMEDQLRRQEKLTAMGELASSVAHEIRNPLNSISMTVQRFRTDFEPKDHREEYYQLVEVMNAEVQRVSTIIRHFLEFARPPKLNPVATSIETFIRDVLAVVESEARARNIDLTANVRFSGSIEMDRQQMSQVMFNLIENAFHAIEGRGKVMIAVVPDREHVRIAVTDTGRGMSPEVREKIFNLYFTTKPEGTGLGLSVAHQVVTEHGGRIEVESEPGKGSTFTVVLPLYRHTAV